MLKLYNSLSRKIETFKPINPKEIGVYTCGPTVYDFAHIGNFRTYTTSDILVRALKFNGFNVKYIMNLTDVGHLTGDNLGDADTGEDRMEKAAKKEGKTAWDVAEFYTDAFLKDYDALNLEQPERFAKATDHIKEQIDLVSKLEKKGFTYATTDGIYFDTSKFKNYGELSDLDQIKEGARVEINDEKKNPRDFALWKFSKTDEKRHMEWKSPWGNGFPGWHIECSAMSMKYLGESFDIHAGGVDLKQTHHPNEIAQAEAATGKKFVNYWVHSAFILIQGERMSKSLGNNYRLYDLEKSGYHPMSLRYLYLQAHYRKELNFTFPSLDGAENALKKLLQDIALWNEPAGALPEYDKRFLDAINDDLNTPQALAVMWEMVKSDHPTAAKAKTLFKMDQVLGLNLFENREVIKRDQGIVPDEIKAMVREREQLRREKRFNLADQLRRKIEKLGYVIEDSKTGPKARKV
ncbi:MAG TPA: cysteine--tRNA ligase [Candidatus Saccharimonadales bacterium]|nr:cysteine--tRNA ligase [Candidatus Saccharimonadales bacterium]